MFPGITQQRGLIALTIVFLLSVLLVWPLGEFPLNDDWSYTKSVTLLLGEGKIHIGDWPAMTLMTHILYGGLFAKVFGFSFFVLRFSTMVSAFLGGIILYRLLLFRGASILTALFSSLVFFYFPVYFNLGFTFMTDVNFCTLLLAFTFMTFRYYESRRGIYLIALLPLAVALVLLRQFGLLAPLAFFTGCLFLRKKQISAIAASLIIIALTYFSLRYYESYLKTILAEWASYKFSQGLGFSDPQFFAALRFKGGSRLPDTVSKCAMALLPLTGSLMYSQIRSFSVLTKTLFLLASALFSFYLVKDTRFFTGNVMVDLNLGPETFYQSTIADDRSRSEVFSLLIRSLQYTGTFCLAFVFFSGLKDLYTHIRSRRETGISRHSAETTAAERALMLFKSVPRPEPLMVFLLAFAVMYIVSLVVAESYFDRYHLPLIMVGLIAIAGSVGDVNIKFWPGLPVLLFFAWISIAGTGDYFRMNRAKWALYQGLRESGVDRTKINGGFEINCWQDGEIQWWNNYTTTEGYDYLIQYDEPEGFETIKSAGFHRGLSWRTDTVSVFLRSNQLP